MNDNFKVYGSVGSQIKNTQIHIVSGINQDGIGAND